MKPEVSLLRAWELVTGSIVKETHLSSLFFDVHFNIVTFLGVCDYRQGMD